MSQPSSFPSSILVDVELPDPAPLSAELVDLLASLRVVLVGWYAVPEQTTPEQARDQFEEQAEAALQEVAHAFEKRGASVQTRLVFTPNELDTISRISTEEDCDAVLIPGEMKHLHRLLVPVRGLHNARHIAPFVADLVQDGTTNVTIVHVLEGGESEGGARDHVLQPMADLLEEGGIDAGIIELLPLEADDPADAIMDLAKNYDVVVMGETRPSIREILFGTVPEAIAETANVPLIVIRHLEEKVEVAERAARTES